MSEYLTPDSDAPERSDEELLSASLVHPHVFALLVRKYEAPFLRKAENIIRDREEAQDIVQEAFTKIYLYGKKFVKQEGASFSSWAYRILINTALTHYAKRKRKGEHVADLDPEIYEMLPDKNLRQFEKKVAADELASMLTRMPEAFARALTAHFIEGKTQAEIAKEEGISLGAVKTRVHRAKKELRKVRETITNRI
jgi:RNA polymerase sigma-70 factor, ECF subfamily